MAVLLADGDRTQALSRWTVPAAAVAAALAGVIVAFRDTAAQVAAIWLHSSAYNYCLLVLPIAGWLIWQRTRRAPLPAPRPAFAALALLPLAGAGWHVARVLSIDEGRHLALLCLIQATLLAVLGWRTYRALLFPFLYLFLLVPTGDFLVGPLQHLAVAVTAAALRASAIPVHLDGNVVEVPTGSFEIAGSCSGLNFILAALALSLLYADLLYRGWRKRLLCVAAALAAAVAVNWLRIYAVIAFDYATDHRTGVAADHQLYGWAIFILVMAPLVALAQAWRDGPDEAPPRGDTGARPAVLPAFARFAGAAAACAALAGMTAAVGPPSNAATPAMPPVGITAQEGA